MNQLTAKSQFHMSVFVFHAPVNALYPIEIEKCWDLFHFWKILIFTQLLPTHKVCPSLLEAP